MFYLLEGSSHNHIKHTCKAWYGAPVEVVSQARHNVTGIVCNADDHFVMHIPFSGNPGQFPGKVSSRVSVC
jgi:hypothetical protein